MHPKTGLEKSPFSAVQTLASTCAQTQGSTTTVLCIRTAVLYVCTYIHTLFIKLS